MITVAPALRRRVGAALVRTLSRRLGRAARRLSANPRAIAVRS